MRHNLLEFAVALLFLRASNIVRVYVIKRSFRRYHRYCRQDIVDTYIDRAMTGTNDNRAAFQKMLADSKKKQFEVVIVYKLDRFARNKYEAINNKHRLRENGVKLISAMENIPDTPEGALMESVLEGLNQYYSEELTQKINRGLRESWIKGNATGGNGLFG